MNVRLFNDKDGNFTCFANNGTSVVDYMIASTTLFPKFTNFGIDNFDISDHMPIYCTLTLNVESHMLLDNTFRQAQGNESYAYEKYRWKQEHKDVFLTKFRENFQNFQQHFRNHEISTIDLLPDFIRLFQNSAENMKCRRNNKTNVNQPEWWDRDCERAKKEKHIFLRHFRQSNSQRSLAEYLASKKRFRQIVNQKKVTLKRLKKQILVNSRKCPKQYWKNIKGNKNQKNVTENIQPNDWFEYFKELLSPQIEAENQNRNLLAEIRQNNDASELNVLITEDEVKQSIIKLHNNKSPGPDGLPAEFFKCTMEQILPYLTTVFNSIFENGNIPDSWGSSIICPLHKKVRCLTLTILEVCL